jgi:nicotinate-nucleotide adenylyltransferase
MKVGVIGGTFDPVHNGHLSIAEEARARLGLAVVVFVPAGHPWFKIDISPVEHRQRMVNLAIAGIPYFQMSAVDVDRPGPSYTVETLADLKSRYGPEMYFILGRGSLAELPQWREPDRLIKMCHLVAVPRPGYPSPDLAALEAYIPGISERLVLLDSPEVDISATKIRERVRRGLPISPLVPEAVEQYIRQHKLYITPD